MVLLLQCEGLSAQLQQRQQLCARAEERASMFEQDSISLKHKCSGLEADNAALHSTCSDKAAEVSPGRPCLTSTARQRP